MTKPITNPDRPLASHDRPLASFGTTQLLVELLGRAQLLVELLDRGAKPDEVHPVDEFLEQCCVFDGGFTRTVTVFEKYRHWAAANALDALVSARWLSREIQSRGHDKVKRNHYFYPFSLTP